MNSVLANNFNPETCRTCQRIEFLDMLNDTVLLIDARNAKILFMNQKGLKMYEYEQAEVSTLTVGSINHDARETWQARMQTIISRGSAGYICAANHVKKNGDILKVELNSRCLVLHGREMIVAVIRDLTADGKLRQELEIAGKVMRRLLPRNMETSLFRMQTVFQPLDGLSGDLFDVYFDEDSQLLYGIIVDVMGHGVAAASQGGILRYLFRQVIEKPITINDKLAWINNEMTPFFAEGGFAAAFLFEFDFKCRMLTYSSAGVTHFVRLTASGPEVVEAPGLFLGINKDEVYDQGVISFQSGDSFFFLTDGLYELVVPALGNAQNFWSMYELCKKLPVGQATDDASGVGLLIR